MTDKKDIFDLINSTEAKRLNEIMQPLPAWATSAKFDGPVTTSITDLPRLIEQSEPVPDTRLTKADVQALNAFFTDAKRRSKQVSEAAAIARAAELARLRARDEYEANKPPAPAQSPATPAPVVAASDEPAPLTTSQIASCFDGFHGWDFDRWRDNLRSPAPWLKKCLHRPGNQGKPFIESTWWPVEIAEALDKKHSKIRPKLHARFKNQEPLKPWLESIQNRLPDDV